MGRKRRKKGTVSKPLVKKARELAEIFSLPELDDSKEVTSRLKALGTFRDLTLMAEPGKLNLESLPDELFQSIDSLGEAVRLEILQEVALVMYMTNDSDVRNSHKRIFGEHELKKAVINFLSSWTTEGMRRTGLVTCNTGNPFNTGEKGYHNINLTRVGRVALSNNGNHPPGL